MIPGALARRRAKPVVAPTSVEAPAEPAALHDRAQDEREVEGGGSLAYRRPGVHRGFATVLFDWLFRT